MVADSRDQVEVLRGDRCRTLRCAAPRLAAGSEPEFGALSVLPTDQMEFDRDLSVTHSVGEVEMLAPIRAPLSVGADELGASEVCKRQLMPFVGVSLHSLPPHYIVVSMLMPKKPKLVVFDLDGTLTASKSSISPTMARLFKKLLEQRIVSVVSGGEWKQFQLQLLDNLNLPEELLKRLFLFPTTGSIMYRFKDGQWRTVYAHKLSVKEKKKIIGAFDEVFIELAYKHPKKVYGEIIQDRITQMSFSGLGQDVVKILGQKKGIALKEKFGATGWPDKIAREAQKKLPEFLVRRGGISTVDVVRKGVDKGYSLKQMRAHLGVPISQMFFVGDRICKGGNDYAVVKTGVRYKQVAGPKETEKVIRELLR